MIDPSGADMTQTVHLYDHQESQPVQLERWEALAAKALPHCLAAGKGDNAPLPVLEEIEISLVSDEAISRVHADFLDDLTPTDVITFHHGEILISLDTAKRQSAEHGEPYEREVALYIVHGLLHLAGWDDRDEAERTAMHELQGRILAVCWSAPTRE